MKVAIITEGESEYRSLPHLYKQISAHTGYDFVPTLKVNIPPFIPLPQLARACASRIKIAQASGADVIIFVFDREQDQMCPGALAGEREKAFRKYFGDQLDVRFVYKNRMFENWLIADVDALKVQTSRFNVSSAVVRAVSPNKADSCDALEILKRMAVKKPYDKVLDAERICRRMDVLKAAKNSRSFRHFLHVLKHETYAMQCKKVG
ncbi:DUF4276 family protein [Yinghuangia sp. YIM S09857]|uniref:DUF4276 family protein n=1 Tax=Yinghuangia sp. YIM S09857 TaxID=3436929 RepID=UPI003F533182